MAVGTGKLYIMYISFAGAIFFVFITFCCFVGMEVLKLKEGTRAIRGFQSLITAIVNNFYFINIFFQLYGGIAGYIYYKKMEETQNAADNEQIEMSDLKGRLIQNY